MQENNKSNPVIATPDNVRRGMRRFFIIVIVCLLVGCYFGHRAGMADAQHPEQIQQMAQKYGS